ncbi:MAG: hypothetical protein IPJ71_04205 [Bdellovibrionales bacterium]|nr:hypothetical protein [Bdellovibrionales bacterium]
MGPRESRNYVRIVLILIFGVAILALPACQKSKFKKDGQTRDRRILPDQDSSRPPSPPVIPTSPQSAYYQHVQQIARPRHTTPDDREDEYSDEDEPKEGYIPPPPTPEVIQQFTHPHTVVEGRQRFVTYEGQLLQTCSQPGCTPLPPSPPPPVLPPSPPCEELKPPCAPAPPPAPAPQPAPHRPEPMEREELPQFSERTEVFSQPSRPPTNRVDILFVVDTSDSILHERLSIVSQIPELIKQLPGTREGVDQVNYKIAALAAHSPNSRLSGRLFSAEAKDPLVLGNVGQARMNIDEITGALQYKMKSMPGERGFDAGEMGLLSLKQFLDSDQLQELKANDQFMREDAVLMVVFIADENDICHHYNKEKGEAPKYDEKVHKNAKAVELFGIPGFDPVEVEAYNRFCGDLGVNPEMTVLDALKRQKKSASFSVSGIVYVNEALVPNKKQMQNGTDRYYDENEIGRGYLDLIQLAGGFPAELANGTYNEAMKSIGKLTSHTMRFQTVFRLPQDERVVIQLGSDGKPFPRMKVTIRRSSGQTVELGQTATFFNQANNEVQVNYDAQPDDTITISYQVEVDAQSGAKSPGVSGGSLYPPAAGNGAPPPPYADGGSPIDGFPVEPPPGNQWPIETPSPDGSDPAGTGGDLSDGNRGEQKIRDTADPGPGEGPMDSDSAGAAPIVRRGPPPPKKAATANKGGGATPAVPPRQKPAAPANPLPNRPVWDTGDSSRGGDL